MDEAYPDELIRSILQSTKTIALVGASANAARPSYGVLEYLIGKGYRLFPVNPGLAGKDLCGARVYARLSDIPERINMVDVFRNSEAAAETVDEALALPQLPKVIWMQLGVRNETAAARARARGVTIIQNRCPKIEYSRLSIQRPS
ncbi:MAG TPA: CoA-binding protein [Beijerinckiaceae bacterium]|nr:CoA-binding protein [Beijerinckiaceae bacterium]